MYQASSIARVLGALLGRRGERGPVGRNVVLLGVTSLVTDVSSEMVGTILPLYLFFGLGLSPFGIGAIDGLYHAVEGIVRVSTAFWADRAGRIKTLAASGYALSAACKLALLVVGSSTGAIAAVVAVDRAGKGVRASPRDALVSASVPRAALGAAFGVHRALDTVGALLGPLAGFALLAIVPGGYDVIFVVSFCAAIVGLSIFVLLVDGRPPRPAEPASAPDVAAKIDARATWSLSGLGPVAIVAGVLSIGAVSDSLFYLVLQRWAAFDARWVPLVFVATALCFAALAIPVGRLADRVGRKRVFVAGHVVLALSYGVVLLAPPGLALVGVCVLCMGAYYAATEGVLVAIASARLGDRHLTTGIAALTTVTSLARFVGSLAFGAIWQVFGFRGALAGALAVLALGVLSAGVLWRPRHDDAGAAG